MEQKQELELDLLELFLYLKKRVLIIGISAVICAILGIVITVFLIPKQYTASARIYVLNQTNESVVYSDFQLSDKLLEDYKVLIKGRNVTKQVIKDLNLDMTTGELSDAISVTAPNDTRVVQISVKHTDPYLAAQITNSVCQTASEQIQAIMDVDAVKLVYGADVPASPSSPNLKVNILLSVAAGAFLSIAVLVVIYLLDEAIHTEEDVERFLGLSTLGVIPISDELGNKQKQAKITRIVSVKKRRSRSEKSRG